MAERNARIEEIRERLDAIRDGSEWGPATAWQIIADARFLLDGIEAFWEALDLVDSPYPIEVFPERTDDERDAIFAAMRTVDKYATEWFYAHVARDRGRVARKSLDEYMEPV